MTGTRTSLSLLVLATAALLMQNGCKSGLSIGSWTIIQSSVSLDAGRVEVTRTLLGEGPTKLDPIGSGLLSVDLRTGRASLTDSSGQAYPLQLSNDITAKLRRGIADRSWMVSRSRLKAKKDADPARAYEMVVFVDDEPLKRTCSWPLPAAKPLPGTLNTVMEIFDQAVRQVHPLSRTVNLIE